MFSDLSYFKMKRILLRNFRNTTVYIETRGILNTRFWIEKSRILINKHKIVISNEDIDCTILLDVINKIKVNDECRIELITKDSQYILEL